MARIPETELQRLKDEVSVQRLVAAAGVELKKAGKDWLGRCPFHQPDTEPSLVVTPAKNLWHCFGCQIGGGPIDWVMKSRGVSFRVLTIGGCNASVTSAMERTEMATTTPDDEVSMLQREYLQSPDLEFLKDDLAFAVARRIVQYQDPDLLKQFPQWVGNLVGEMCDTYEEHGHYGLITSRGTTADHSEMVGQLVKLLRPGR